MNCNYIYVLGLEHSGTTLLNHLLGVSPRVVALGEVAQFFDPTHMASYIARWKAYDDVRRCSCGADWDTCEFWAPILDLCGLYSDVPVTHKYSRLVRHVRKQFGEDTVIADSSKRLGVLMELFASESATGIRAESIFVALCVKDPRSFAASIQKKSGGRASTLSHLRTLNWWLGENRRMLAFLEKTKVRYIGVLYEKLCRDPQAVIAEILDRNGLNAQVEVDTRQALSHIAMGNKDFTVRNRAAIRYDGEWFIDDSINLAYLLHVKARAFNRGLYKW